MGVEVGFGPTLLFTDSSGDLEWADELVLKPQTNVGPWDEPYQAEDGCWRFPEGGRQPVLSSLEWRSLGRSQSVSEEYTVYTAGGMGSCLPTGEYRFQDEAYAGSEDRAMTLALVIEVDGNRQLSVSAEEPTIHPAEG